MSVVLSLSFSMTRSLAAVPSFKSKDWEALAMRFLTSWLLGAVLPKNSRSYLFVGYWLDAWVLATLISSFLLSYFFRIGVLVKSLVLLRLP